MGNLEGAPTIAFAVYRREVEFKQQLKSDETYGDLINRLSKDWSWINVKKYFSKSREIQKFFADNTFASTSSEVIFMDWLQRVLKKFLESKCKYIVIINSTLCLPESFEQMVQRLVQNLPEPHLAISLWPTSSIASKSTVENHELYHSDNLSSLGFLLTRSACEKFLETLHQTALFDFSDLVKKSELKCLSISDKSPDRPYLWLEILASEESWNQRNIKEQTADDLMLTSKSLDKNPKVHAFISHWFSTWENIHNIEEACMNAGYLTYVLNTTEVDHTRWMNNTPISFFRQFETACNHFDSSSDFMLFITADIYSNEWKEFFDYANEILGLNCLGSFSPSLTYEFHQIGRYPNIFFDTGLPLVITHSNDLVLTYINRSVILAMKEFFYYFCLADDTFDPIVGYGLMEILAQLARSEELVNLRDRSFTFLHPKGSSYDISLAEAERDRILVIAKRFCLSKGQEWSLPKELPSLNFDISHVLSEVQRLR